MLEDQVAFLLQKYLGNYVRGLNKDALKISAWRGDVELTNMQLKPEALNALKLPVNVKAGFLGSVKLKVPWSRLGQEPVLVHLDRIFVLAEPATQVEGCSEDSVQEVKKARVREMERKLVERSQQLTTEMNRSWLGSLINTVIGNLKLSITNIHIRYEDTESNPGHPFAAGVMLSKLLAFTVDDDGNETFATGGALDSIRKSVELDRLAVYLDSDVSPWNVVKPWKEMLPSEWSVRFEIGSEEGKLEKNSASRHSYVLHPVSGDAKYTKVPTDGAKHNGEPALKAAINLEDVTLCLSKEGYCDLLQLAENFAAFNQRLKYACYRPHVSVKSNARLWWKYAYKVISDVMKKASGKLAWDQVLKYARLRKKYISLYISLLKADPSRLVIDDNKEINNLDLELDIDVIILWRMLAHKFVQKSSEYEAYQKKRNAGKSWWSLPWSGSSDTNEDEPGPLKEEDWNQLNEIIGYKKGAEEPTFSQDGGSLNAYLEINMKHNASRLTERHLSLAELSCDNLECHVKLYPETKIFDLQLGSYRLSSPKGTLAESATSYNSFVGSFAYKPFDSEVDWSLAAKASPCYMTYLNDPVNEIIHFFRSSNAVNRTMVLDTAAALQVTIDGVKRSAQQQVSRALKNQTRFLLNLDIAAPKVTIPTDLSPNNSKATKLLIDLGHLILHTQDDSNGDTQEERELYMQFYIALTEVSAFLVDGNYNWSDHLPKVPAAYLDGGNINLLPVIDNCGIVLKLQQIRVERPPFPSMRVGIRVPTLGFHFSPARYHRLMQVVKIFQKDDLADLPRPWVESDFEGWLSLLSWKGVGNREAVWLHRYVCLVGTFLYVLENPDAKTYKRSLSLPGKQIYHVPSECVGNVEHVLAIGDPGLSSVKIIESNSGIIFRFEAEDSRKAWQRRLQSTIYRASHSAGFTNLAEISSDNEDAVPETVDRARSTSMTENIFITGSLDELKICLSCNPHSNQNFEKIMSTKESPFLEFRAIGGQVEVSSRPNDLLIGTLLKSLEVEDLHKFYSGMPAPRYLARSFYENKALSEPSTPAISAHRSRSSGRSNSNPFDEEESFYEASSDLTDLNDSSSLSRDGKNLSLEKESVSPPGFDRIPGLLPDADLRGRKRDIKMNDGLDGFVKAQIIFYDPESPHYDKIDKQVIVSLATLSFFCYRPTILALLDFMNAINLKDDTVHERNNDSSNDDIDSETVKRDLTSSPTSDMINEPVVEGLLGRGKSRVIFYLSLNMHQAQIFLMMEDGKKLATIMQNNLVADIKVFPSSFGIKAAVGNLKISDDSLSQSHSYFWICDMRDPRGSSFVELEFSSFVAGDEDYSGFEYSFSGSLSEVRIVFLNRFVQEIVNYFMGLVPTGARARSVVILKDQMTNSEKWFSRAEVEGSPAVKLDLTLKKPIIIMPRRTNSPDYLELDVVHITVQNSFKWLLGDKNDLSAVRLDIMSLLVEDINLTIGVGSGSCGSIIQDVKGLSLVIKRTLRDLLHQVPAIEIAIEMEELKAALSNKEYQIITECAMSNLSETPRKIQSLATPASDTSGQSKSVDVDASTDASTQVSQNIDSWITLEVSVSIQLVQLSLHSGSTRDSALATMQVMGAWLHYKSTSLNEGYLLSTLKGFSVTDDREGTKPEHRLAIGRSDASHYVSLDRIIEYHNGHKMSNESNFHFKNNEDSVLTMLVLDVKFSPSSTLVSVYLQRPQLLVALDFLLAVVEFFVPNIRGMMSSEESENLLRLAGSVAINEPVFYQPCPEFVISPARPLVADDERYDRLVYDGKGGRLYLQNSQGTNLTCPSGEPFIYVGSGKMLQFRNVFIMNGEYLDSCILLGTNSCYTASEADLVYLEKANDVGSHIVESIDKHVPQAPAEEKSMELILEMQAVGPELTFYDSSINVGESTILSNKLLHAQLDIFGKVVMKGEAIEMSASTLGLMIESNGIQILEPLDIMMEFSNASGKTSIRLVTSDILMNYSFSLLKLFLAVEEDILAFLRMTSKKPTIECTQFDNVGKIHNNQTKQIFALWRPRAPHGFAVLGDCLTPTNDPPTKGVLAVNTSFVRVKRPISFKPIWPLSLVGDTGRDNNQDIQELVPKVDADDGNDCSVWLPVAPPGYVALGCVASIGNSPPPLSSAMCILASYVAPCALKDCVAINSLESSSIATFWRVDNSLESFLPSDPSNMSVAREAYELRHIVFGHFEKAEKAEAAVISRGLDKHTSRQERYDTGTTSSHVEPTSTFELVWWDRGSTSDKNISIWRPIVADRMVYLGDVVVSGYEPPCASAVLEDNRDDTILKPPLDFQLVGKIKKQRGVESISFWLPQAPPGFVSLGCIACKGHPKPTEVDALRCIRNDMVTGGNFPEESLWNTSTANLAADTFSIWTVGGESGTFIVRNGLRKPPKRLALKLVDADLSRGTDSMSINTEITTFSAVFYDDFVGLMVPLCNISLNDIGVSLRGTPDYLTANVNFSLAARSYNDRYNSWEPLIEPINGFLRYHSCLTASTSAPQLRITSAQDLNLNISVSNINMMLQAYSSWTNLCNVESFKKRDFSLPRHDQHSVMDPQQSRKFSIVPQNRLGQDIYMRAVESRGLSDIIKLLAGDAKLVKVPVLRNMVDAHPRGGSRKISWLSLTVVVSDVELPRSEGLDCHCYTITICLYPAEDTPGDFLPRKQSARTRGVLSKPLVSGMDLVVLHETFFFLIDSMENVMIEFKVTDVRKGEVVGCHSSSLKDVVCDTGSRSSFSDELSWSILPLKRTMMNKERDSEASIGKLRCAVVLWPNAEQDDVNSNVSGRNSGFIQISPSRNGPWTTVRLNYAAPAACWRLGDVLVASEVSLNEGNIFLNMRSLASVTNRTDFVLDVSLKSRNYESKLNSQEVKEETDKEDVEKKPTVTDNMNSANYLRQKRLTQSEKQVPDCSYSVGRLNPGDTISLPLASLTSTEGYCIFQTRPIEDSEPNEFSWSSVLDLSHVTKSAEVSAVPNEPSEIDVSDLKECQKLLCCKQECGSSSDDFQDVWLFLSLKASEIGKDVNLDPIQDWKLVVDSPLSITNFLPHSFEYSIFEQPEQQLIPRSQGVLQPGETARIYNADPRSPLYISLLPQGGWQPINETVLISHPSGNISKTISFKSPFSGRNLQVFLEQSQGKEQLAPKAVRVYAPYWIICDKCPSLKYRLTDLSGRKRSRSFSLPFHPSRANEKIVGHIMEDEMTGGCSVASGLKFDQLGLSVSVAHSGEEQFGPVKELSPLKDMDGSIDLYAYDGGGNCLRLFVSSKPCPYPSVPSKIISIRPYVTFTNRLGKDIYIRLSNEDPPKPLRAYDSRVSFTYSSKAQECEKLQVRLDDTDWCFPVALVKEDTLSTVLRNRNGGLTILRTEIRGYEEGSRFIVIFRLGYCNVPIKVENRTKVAISIRQSGLTDDAFTELVPLSTIGYAWEDPYGQRAIDIRISSENGYLLERFCFDKSLTSPFNEIFDNIQLHMIEVKGMKVIRFIEEGKKIKVPDEGNTMIVSNSSTPATQKDARNNALPLEIIVELGVLGVSLIDHRPRELLYLYVERVFISYISGSDEMAASRLKVILGYLQLDNQLPLALMPVLLVPENIDTRHPVFKMTISVNNSVTDGTLVYPFVYARVTEKPWRVNIHEPIIWALLDFYNNLQIDKIPSSSNVTAVDPELRIDLIDVSEMRLKLSLEPDPDQRPRGVLGVWSPILSVVGNAFKIQIHLRKVTHRNRFMRKSSVVPAISNRILRDLVHNPLHLIFAVDVLGMTSSTLASLSKGFAELSTDVQFQELRSKQVWSRRITGVSDGFVQGTEALAQGFAFGVSGVLRKPVESAKEHGILGLAYGFGRAFVGFVAQPVSGALDFFSMTVDGIGASCSRCLEIFTNKHMYQRIRNPRAIHVDGVIKEHCEREATGQMILYLAEASTHFGCTDIFKEPSKYAWSDYYEDYFILVRQKILLLTNKRAMLLQCLALDKLDKRPCKIIWDVPWEELLALELAKAGRSKPSLLLLHLKNFKPSESYVRVVKCSEEEEYGESLAVKICSVVRKSWKHYLASNETVTVKVPASRRRAQLAWDECGEGSSRSRIHPSIKPDEKFSSGSSSGVKFVERTVNFVKIWSSERETKRKCNLCPKQVEDNAGLCSIWRPICPDGYISVGDITRVGAHPPNVAVVYQNLQGRFALPIGYDLVWRNCLDDYITPISIWLPRAPEGYVSLGCVAVASFTEPEEDAAYCVASNFVEEAEFEEQMVWNAADSYPWSCYIYQIQSEALQFAALRQPREVSDWKPSRVSNYS